jgi:hypothetical protein
MKNNYTTYYYNLIAYNHAYDYVLNTFCQDKN